MDAPGRVPYGDELIRDELILALLGVEPELPSVTAIKFVSLNRSFNMNWKEHISSDPEIMFRNMVIKGTRIPVELILEKLGAGNTMEDLIQAYPRIAAEDVRACLLFAADNTKHEKTLAVA